MTANTLHKPNTVDDIYTPNHDVQLKITGTWLMRMLLKCVYIYMFVYVEYILICWDTFYNSHTTNIFIAAAALRCGSARGY